MQACPRQGGDHERRRVALAPPKKEGAPGKYILLASRPHRHPTLRSAAARATFFEESGAATR